jgi:hypothetical protein
MLVLAGCITVTRTAGQDEEVPAPDRFEGEAPPPLEPTPEPGWFTAPTLDPTLYYSESDDLWYRYAYNRWYLAYKWNGAWWIPDKTPKYLLTQVKIAEERSDVKTQLKDLEERLKEIERKEQEEAEKAAKEGGGAPDPN